MIEIGKVYTNGKLTREVIKIDHNEVHYKNQSGEKKNCWITTFEDWVSKGNRSLKEYVGVYVQPCIQTFSARIKAKTEEQAKEKFIKYIVEAISGEYQHAISEDNINLIELSKLDVL